MKSVPVVEAKAHFSALLAEVEAGAEIAVTRHGKVIARIVPDHPQSAADIFRDFWPDADEIDLIKPEDRPAEPVASWDD
ncbi:type II toxin-antitoxin system Phd/YefM family antitoxin [Methylobacterium sp. NFXW15]|uniref:type II toxin-antitoxin system Phd/YefM family antitoxin n=1 Tax=Methylobacterium sp. NFXW15 TaxID=2819512 RepID=UPI003CECD6FE